MGQPSVVFTLKLTKGEQKKSWNCKTNIENAIAAKTVESTEIIGPEFLAQVLSPMM